MYCSKCGTQNPDDASFCSKCGNVLIKIEEVKKIETNANQEPKKKGSGWKTLFFIIIGLAVIGAIFGNHSDTNAASSQAITSTVTPTVSSQAITSTVTPIPLAKIGDRVIVDDFAYTFNGMTTSTAIGEYLGGQFYGDQANGIYLILDVTIENVGKESDNILIGSNVKIVDDQGRKYEHDSTAEYDLEIYLKQDTFMGIPQLQPGLPKRGKIVFDVPQNLNGKIELSGGLFSEKRYISLSNTVGSAPVNSQTPTESITTSTTNAVVAKGEIWDAGNGYSLKVIDIDLNTPRTVLIELYKNGNILDRMALPEGKTYTYGTVFIANVNSISDAGIVFEHTKT
jgi:hypothetical protein